MTTYKAGQRIEHIKRKHDQNGTVIEQRKKTVQVRWDTYRTREGHDHSGVYTDSIRLIEG
jgi:hypothetical protein